MRNERGGISHADTGLPLLEQKKQAKGIMPMNEIENLTAKVKRCNENIVKFAKEYAADYLCDFMDSDSIDLQKAVEIAESTNVGNGASKSELAEFGILLFWFNLRSFYSNKLLVVFEEAG